MMIHDVKRKLTEYNAQVANFVEKYRQEDDHVYYDVGEWSYVIHANQFGLHYNEPTVPESDIVAFENKHDIRLPEDYRAFLLEFSNGGKNTPGPWLRLYPFQRVETQLEGEPSKPFPYTDRWNMQFDPVHDPYDKRHIQGTINIGTDGCTIEFILVVTGDERGHVWIDDREGDYGIWPLVIHDRRVSHGHGYIASEKLPRVSFLIWYERWLDSHIKSISNWRGKYGS